MTGVMRHSGCICPPSLFSLSPSRFFFPVLLGRWLCVYMEYHILVLFKGSYTFVQSLSNSSDRAAKTDSKKAGDMNIQKNFVFVSVVIVTFR